MHHFVNNYASKNQYQNLNTGRTSERTSIRVLLNVAIIALCFTFLLLSLRFLHQRQSVKNHVFIYVDTRQPVQYTTSTQFLSFGLDSSLLRDMKQLPIADEKFINLARHLSPAFVRIGGTSADCLFFNQTAPREEVEERYVGGQDISNFTLTDQSFKALHEFAMKAQIRMIFDLNALIRNPDGSWNTTNAREIIQFARSQNMDLDWQLGNEPNSFYHVFNVTITAEQLAKDYNELRMILKEFGYGGSLVVGPEVNHIGDKNHKGEFYAKVFLDYERHGIDYVTWHQYYLNGHECKLEDFINPATFNALPMQIKSVQETIDATGKQLSMWLSETSTAYGGGAPELSDTFVAGFLWLDKLGYSASTGVNVVIRQSFFGGNYAMVGPNIVPNPDWWVSVMFKQFVSEKVIQLVTSNNFGYVRLYAHCTPQKAFINRIPAMTLYGVNIQGTYARIDISGLFPILTNGAKIFYYILTSDSLQSRNIQLNGKTLTLKENGDLPPFHPIIMEPTKIITLPAYSMIFMVFHGIDFPMCASQG